MNVRDIFSPVIVHAWYWFLAGDLEEEGGDLSLNLKLLSVLDNPAIVVAAAASGDVGTLREFLARHPSQVWKVYCGTR